MVRLENVLESWKAIRQDTAQAVEDLPAGELDFRPIPEMMSFRETARHILDAGHGLAGMMLAGEELLRGPDFRDRIKKYLMDLGEQPDAAALAAALRRSVEQRAAELARQPAEFFNGIITRMDGQQVTRLEMVQTIKEHELTHRAQLFVHLRMKGIVPATTRRRMAQQAGSK